MSDVPTPTLTRDTTPTPQADSSKDGEFYDRCPKDGCIETERIFKHGGRTGSGEDYLNWSMYNAHPKQGGCGYTWSRDTKQGLEANQAKGINPKWLTKSAQTGRSYSLPSEQFRDNFGRIDWSK